MHVVHGNAKRSTHILFKVLVYVFSVKISVVDVYIWNAKIFFYVHSLAVAAKYPVNNARLVHVVVFFCDNTMAY